VKDVNSNRIVGYSIGDGMKSSLAAAALRMAIRRRGGSTGTVVHSDRGSQFRSTRYARRWRTTGLSVRWDASVPADNAASERFVSPLQNNFLDTQRWAIRDQLRPAIVTWVERIYHRRRRQRQSYRLA
jgi:putative transposase